MNIFKRCKNYDNMFVLKMEMTYMREMFIHNNNNLMMIELCVIIYFCRVL